MSEWRFHRFSHPTLTFSSDAQHSLPPSSFSLRLGFLPAQPNPSDLYFRSTNMSRTVESLQQGQPAAFQPSLDRLLLRSCQNVRLNLLALSPCEVIAGLYPAETRGQWRPEVNIRNMTEGPYSVHSFHRERKLTLICWDYRITTS
jgi:hypothetical protein